MVQCKNAEHSLIPPAAPSKCPVMDFVELTGIRWACSPNTCLMAFVSMASAIVDVPWALIYPMSVFATPASLSAMSVQRTALRLFWRRGDMVRITVHPHSRSTQHKCVRHGHGVLQFFEDHHPSPFAQEQTRHGPCRTAGWPWLVHCFLKESGRVKPGDTQWGDRASAPPAIATSASFR